MDALAIIQVFLWPLCVGGFWFLYNHVGGFKRELDKVKIDFQAAADSIRLDAAGLRERIAKNEAVTEGVKGLLEDIRAHLIRIEERIERLPGAH